MKKYVHFRGYTFPELIITVGIFLILIAIVTINLSVSNQKTTLTTSITTLVADFRSQQLKAMNGDTEGRASPDSYGIYFESNKYTLFHGSSYNPNDGTNFVVTMPPTQQFQTINKTVLFFRINGQVNGYSSSANTIVLLNTSTNEQKTLQFNQFGVITQVN